MNRHAVWLLWTFAGALALLEACSPGVTHVAPVTIVSGIDFTRYTQRGFLFTPEVYDGPYEAVGLITVTRYAEGRFNQETASWDFDPISVRDVVDSIYARATAIGADALMRFHLENVMGPPAAARLPATPGLEVSGFAIRRRGSPPSK